MMLEHFASLVSKYDVKCVEKSTLFLQCKTKYKFYFSEIFEDYLRFGSRHEFQHPALSKQFGRKFGSLKGRD